MKIAGVYTDKKRRGDPIEYTPAQKIPVAVITAAANLDPEYAISVENVETTNLRFSPKGDLLKKKFQHNNYYAEGTAVFTKRRRKGDVLLEPRKKRFVLEFCDCLSVNGLPEFEIGKFEIH